LWDDDEFLVPGLDERCLSGATYGVYFRSSAFFTAQLLNDKWRGFALGGKL
jgi:hypothetical protein